MIAEKTSRIYLAAQRGHSIEKGYEAYHTLNYKNYAQEGKGPFSSLMAVNDVLLSPQEELNIESQYYKIVIPLAGHLRIIENNAFILNVEEVLHSNSSVLHLKNPFNEHYINFLVLESEIFCDTTSTSFDFNIKNQLQNISANDEQKDVQIGIYNGRHEGSLTTKSNNLFILIIEGAFEVDNKLLERRDCLSISNTETLEFEALSDNAIILIMNL